MIVLKGDLDIDLQRLGLKAGDVINTHSDPMPTTGSVQFTVGSTHCVLWPENYTLPENDPPVYEKKETTPEVLPEVKYMVILRSGPVEYDDALVLKKELDHITNMTTTIEKV